MRDSGLMAAILALSSRQLSINPNASENERDRKIGLQYYYDTLHYLQRAMSNDAYTVSLELLATSLIVSMYEMLDDSGNGSGWGRHLKGIFWIQRSQLIEGETGGLKSAVWWAWLRQDIWAAFREHRKTLSIWTPTKTYAAMNSYEIAARIVWIFAKVVDYCSDEEMAASRNNLVQRLERAEVILNMLKEWETNLPDEFKPLPGFQKASPTDCFKPLWIHPPAFGKFGWRISRIEQCKVNVRNSCLDAVPPCRKDSDLTTQAITRRDRRTCGATEARDNSCLHDMPNSYYAY